MSRRSRRAFRSLATAVILALLAAAIVAACQPGTTASPYDHRAPASWNQFASCPREDAGRIKDAALAWPDQWVCAR